MLKASRSIDWKPLKRTGYELGVFTSIRHISNIWEQLAPSYDTFQGRKYLEVLESNPPEGMSFCYLVFRKKGKAIGLAACQIQRVNVDKSMNRKEKESKKGPCFFTVIGRFLKELVASKVEFTTFICGNILLTGEHGYYFTPDEISPKEAFELIDEGIVLAKDFLNEQGGNVNGFLLKDFYSSSRDEAFIPANTKLIEFTVEPNMVMYMDAKWTCYDDYLASMSSKYRVRAKKAAKSAKDIVKQSLDENQILEHKDELYRLYKSVAENSGFNLVNLNVNYLQALKKEFKDDFTLDAYFLDGKLIAFYTTILNGEELEAHFLGFDRSFNRKYQVYLNILYDIARIGIEKQVEKIVYARTALEIKSSVGAQPMDMYCYMRHPNSFSNKFVGPILECLKPKQEDWVARQPFKDRERY